MRRRLIVNADDFGMSRGITDGVILAHRFGFLTSASLMVNMPATEYALSRLATVPKLGVGIHLNICQGRPVLAASEVRSLVDSGGHFHPPSTMVRKLWHWRVSEREIEAEFRAQIRWMADRGVTPTHADSHHHMHMYPAAVLPFVRALRAERVQCTRAACCSRWPKNRTLGGPHRGSLARRIIVQTYRRALHAIVFRNLGAADSRVSFVLRDGQHLGSLGEQWKASLEHLPEGTYELACHPGFFEKGFSETDRIHVQREEELDYLTDTQLRAVVERRGIQLITYRALSHGGIMRHTSQGVAAL